MNVEELLKRTAVYEEVAVGDEVLIPVELVVKMRALLQQLQWRDVREGIPEGVKGVDYVTQDRDGQTYWFALPPHNVEEG